MKTFLLLLALFPIFSLADPVKIGIITDLSGRMAHWGTQTRRGAELARDELQAAGLDVQLLFEDAVLESMKAVAGAQKLLRVDTVDAIYSEFTPISVAIAPMMKNSGKIFIFDAGASSPLSAYEYAYKSYIDYVAFCREAVTRWRARGLKKFATLKMNAEPGEHCEMGVRSIEPEALSVPYNVNEDLTAMVTQLKQKQIEAVAMVGFEPDLLNFLKAAKTMNFSGSMSINQNAVGDQVKRLYTNLLHRFEFYGLPPVENDFLVKLRNKFHDAPETSLEAAAIAYLHIRQLGEALKGCTSRSAECVSRNLAESPARDVIGFTGWKDRVAQFRLVFWAWNKDHWEPQE